MVKLNIVLVVIASDIKNRQNASILTDTQNGAIHLPAKELRLDQTSKVVAANMLEEYTGVSSNWAILTPLGVFDDTNKQEEINSYFIRVVDIGFSVYIPEPTRQRQPTLRWIPFKELNELNIKGKFYTDEFNMVSAAIWRPI